MMIGPWFLPSPPAGFVLDALVPATWGCSRRGTAYTSGVLGRILSLGACVPLSWPQHVAESLRVAEGRGWTTATAADRFLSGLPSLPIFVDSETPARAWPEILDVARKFNLPVFDAAYLELALRLKLPLATADPALSHAGTAAGVTPFTP